MAAAAIPRVFHGPVGTYIARLHPVGELNRSFDRRSVNSSDVCRYFTFHQTRRRCRRSATISGSTQHRGRRRNEFDGISSVSFFVRSRTIGHKEARLLDDSLDSRASELRLNRKKYSKTCRIYVQRNVVLVLESFIFLFSFRLPRRAARVKSRTARKRYKCAFGKLNGSSIKK